MRIGIRFVLNIFIQLQLQNIPIYIFTKGLDRRLSLYMNPFPKIFTLMLQITWQMEAENRSNQNKFVSAKMVTHIENLKHEYIMKFNFYWKRPVSLINL